MTCAATSGHCGASTHFAPSAPAIFIPSTPRRKLTAKERARKQNRKTKRAQKKRQRKGVRDEAKADTKAKVPDAGSEKAKFQLYVTLLKLKLHL